MPQKKKDRLKAVGAEGVGQVEALPGDPLEGGVGEGADEREGQESLGDQNRPGGEEKPQRPQQPLPAEEKVDNDAEKDGGHGQKGPEETGHKTFRAKIPDRQQKTEGNGEEGGYQRRTQGEA